MSCLFLWCFFHFFPFIVCVKFQVAGKEHLCLTLSLQQTFSFPTPEIPKELSETRLWIGLLESFVCGLSRTRSLNSFFFQIGLGPCFDELFTGPKTFSSFLFLFRTGLRSVCMPLDVCWVFMNNLKMIFLSCLLLFSPKAFEGFSWG